MSIRVQDGIKFEEVEFTKYSTNMGMVVVISFPYIDQSIFESIDLSDDIDEYFFSQAEKGVMYGEKEIHCRVNDDDFTMKWEITTYCDENEHDDDDE